MEVSIQAPAGLQREMHVTIPADRVAKAIDQRLRDISRRAKLPGFRPGKAPYKVIQQQFGSSARMEVVTDLVQSSYPEALVRSGVRPAGQPRIDVTAERPGEALQYVAHFEVFPEIQVLGLEALEVESPLVDVTEADVDRLVLNLRRGRRVLADASRPVATGDLVKVDFEGRLDGELFEGGKGDNVEVEIGLKQFLPDMENAIVGHSLGETFEAAVSFPDDYRAESLRGKTAQFSMTLKSHREIILPQLDDPAFLEAHSAVSVDDLRAKAMIALENERKKAIHNRQKTQLMEQLATRNPLDVPQSLIDQEVPRVRDEAAQRMNLKQVPPEQLEQMLPGKLFEPAAKRKVALGLLLGEIIKQKEIRLDPVRVEQALESMATDFEQPEEVKAYYRSKPGMLDGLRSMVLEDQVVDVLLAAAAKVEKIMTLEQLLNPKAQA